MAYSQQHFFAAMVVLAFVVSHVHGQRMRHGKKQRIRCGPNYYIGRTSSGDHECILCPQGCDPGTKIVTQCGFGRQQKCEPCTPTPGKTCTTGVEQTCILCEVAGRTVEVECNIYNQTQCGGCKKGYYENLDDAKIGGMRYCRKCTSEDSRREECKLQPTSKQVTSSATGAEQTTSEQTATIVAQLQEEPETVESLIQRLHQTTKDIKVIKDKKEWGPLVAGAATLLLIVILLAYVVHRYRSYDEQKGKEPKDIEMDTLSEVEEEGEMNASVSLCQSNPVCADTTPKDLHLPPGSCGHGVVHAPQGTEYDRLIAQGKGVGKDMPIEDHLTLDIQQAIALRINQRPAIPGDPDYKNVFIDLGVDTDKVAAANATGIDDPSARLFSVLRTESSAREIKMADIITTLDKYEFYDLVKVVCKDITKTVPQE